MTDCLKANFTQNLCNDVRKRGLKHQQLMIIFKLKRQCISYHACRTTKKKSFTTGNGIITNCKT